jgi:ABC-type Mn2+/Zn2+ transport system ATPase subunit
VGVLGSVGSGKSSLLSAIIGDVRKTEGEVALFGNVAYAAQTPWCVAYAGFSSTFTHKRIGFFLRWFEVIYFFHMSTMRRFITLLSKVCTQLTVLGLD